jgi:SAM-dependent methyltransferase
MSSDTRYAIRDTAAPRGARAPVRLDIGCGRSKFAGTLGVDVAPVPGVDLAADLSAGLPFADDSVDEIFTSHTLEHMPDLIAAMEELWRVCKDGARLNIWVPHASCPFVTWIDPTHRRGMTIETFSYFNPASNHLSYYSRARFTIEYARLHLSTIGMRRAGFRRSRGVLATIVEALANRSRGWQYRAERWWGPLIGFDEAHVILRAHK